MSVKLSEELNVARVRRLPAVSAEQPRRTLVVSANGYWNILNFRSGLVQHLIASGREVHVIAPDDGHGPKLRELGAEVYSIPLKSSSLSPIDDVVTFVSYIRLFRRIRPDSFLAFTIKPNIYGGLAARLCGVRRYNNISGLGTAFARPGPLQRLVAILYRLALAGSCKVFFQNKEDRALFEGRGISQPRQGGVLPGSGVDLRRFSPIDRRRRSGAVRFLLVARMLSDKGVAEFVDASRLILKSRPNFANFVLLGPIGVDNRAAIDRRTIDRWVREGVVEYWGEVTDVRQSISKADCVVLPSYREGVPRSLIEAAAMATPIIGTNVPGCRDIVDDCVNGYLCQVRSARSLADAIERMIDIGEEGRHQLGLAGRAKVERDFDEHIILEAYGSALNDCS
ncbi:glycosyltransferase family 4 protein [Sphingomonas sp. LY29]|uniref:glycosyltransferase family 4 protein n=1 Tax=Sphingomonas sp. LY29 TaxID=3095341 RepID=UPI002D7672C2|nr:glycosyltransferase family 4 protein [Sphingomonas sp. LY29]WRP26249.1 glycosyltransferase family 4 protein [Sphingomonas sp. LY29]